MDFQLKNETCNSFWLEMKARDVKRKYKSEDHMLPYCLSPKHAPDTLFILTEEDWRLCEADCRPLHTSDAYRRYEESIRSSVPAPAGQAASSSSAEPIAAPGADKTEWEPLPEADWGDDDDMDAEPIAAPASSSASKDVTVEPVATVPEPQTWLRRCLKTEGSQGDLPGKLEGRGAHVHLRASARVRRFCVVVLGRQDVCTKNASVSRLNCHRCNADWGEAFVGNDARGASTDACRHSLQRTLGSGLVARENARFIRVEIRWFFRAALVQRGAGLRA